jgi:FtsP/CotA-like multicopper oxidase with cupredoxin domain
MRSVEFGAGAVWSVLVLTSIACEVSSGRDVRVSDAPTFDVPSAGFLAEHALFEEGFGFQPEALPGGTLDLTAVPRYETPLVIPPAMPKTGKVVVQGGKNVDYYEIAVRQFSQYILPESTGKPTEVWSYGNPAEPSSFNYPAFTIEAKWNKPVRVKWLNELVKDPDDCFHNPNGPAEDSSCNYLPHLLPVDQTLHWANPVGICKSGADRPDCRGVSDEPYLGPVPIVTHVHGAHTTEDSDGYPEAWVLPDANDIPDDIQFTGGTFYDRFKSSFESKWGMSRLTSWTPGASVYQYPNDMRATTLWYHDHSLGITRLNVYAGPAGFFLLRGGPADHVRAGNGKKASLPGPAPALGDPPGVRYYEIPIVIQGRSFNADGSLFYPSDREFFEGLEAGDLAAMGVEFTGPDSLSSDVSPIWNPEFFGNTMVVNGKTWPYLDVEPRRYRFRLLNGCDSRFLILQLVKATDPSTPSTWVKVEGAITQVGAEGGFLPSPQPLDDLLIAPAERADVIVDFGAITLGENQKLYLVNIGPDEPYGGGEPGVDFLKAHPGTTGQVMRFDFVPREGADESTPADELRLPHRKPLPAASVTRYLSLNEEESANQTICVDEEGEPLPIPPPCPDGASEVPFGPTAALLGTLNQDGTTNALTWSAPITETPTERGTEVWEIYNFTADAHPIHIHLVQFEVVDRQLLAVDEEGMATQPALLCQDADTQSDPACMGRGWAVRDPESWETGLKDTVVAYPGEVTRVKARFDTPGLFVWHCHILEHEDNEMMRPYCVRAEGGGVPASCEDAGVAP